MPGWICRLPRRIRIGAHYCRRFEGHSRRTASLLRLRHSGTGKLHSVLEGHSDIVDGVTSSLDAKLVASGAAFTPLKLWNSATGASTLMILGDCVKCRDVDR
jgi:WD40 repeat protein